MSTELKKMEKKLYDACLKGDVKMLEALMREDQLTLARISLSSCFNQTPLHLACMLGHFELAKALLSYKPEFANKLDSQGRSPLHLASANGYANIVELLLLQNGQKMCRICDEDGRTPLHLAVMNGEDECVSQLIKVNYDCGQEWTILHLCVMYNRLNVLILVLEFNEINVQDLSNTKDDKGNTILHFAAGSRRMQMIKYLLNNRSQGLDVNALNGDGLTALDIIEQMPRDAQTVEIKELLISAGTLRAKETEPASTTTILRAPLPKPDKGSKPVKMLKKPKKKGIFGKTLEKSDKSLLVAASVIAAMAYQAAISPPGGIASVEDASAPIPPQSFDNPFFQFHSYKLSPADSLLAYFRGSLSDIFWISNTISFLAALSVIFLYASGGSPKRRFFIWLVRLSMWITLTSMAVAYVIAVIAVTPATNNFEELIKSPTLRALSYGITAWVGLLLLSTLVLVYLFISYIVRTIVRKITRLFRKKDTSQDTFRTSNANIV